MTLEEKRLHRAKLLIELEDAESDLSYARDSAIGFAEGLEEIASVLRKNAEMEPSSDDFTAEADIANRLNPTQLARLQNWQSVTAAISEMKHSRQTLFNLRKRKSSLPLVGMS